MGHWKKHSHDVVSNGYGIVPIKEGAKRPIIKKWQNNWVGSTDDINSRFDNCGIGIVTGTGDVPVYAVDVDTLDPEVSEQFKKYITEKYPDILIRTGKAPKLLYLFKGEQADITKSISRWFHDILGDKHRLEILGKGQQFVSHHIHPDTGKDYEWDMINGDPTSISATDLPVLPQEDIEELITVFETFCIDAEMIPKGNSTLGHESKNGDDDDILMASPPIEFDDESELWDDLNCLNPEEYETWMNVGMALHHQYSFPEPNVNAAEHLSIGLQMWNEWSSEAGNYAGENDLRERWRDFKVGKSGGVTFRSIRYEADKIRKKENKELYMEVYADTIQLINATNDHFEMTMETIPEVKLQLLEFPRLKETFARHIQARMEGIDGAKPPIVDIRRDLKNARAKTEEKSWAEWANKCPKWAKKWVYIADSNVMLHSRSSLTIDPAGFRGMYNSQMLEGDAESIDAINFLLNNELIPKVHSRMYDPTKKVFWNEKGTRYCNLYRKGGVGEIPKNWSKEGKRAAKLFKQHIINTCGGWNREAKILASWLKWNIEQPGFRIRWAVLMEGRQGDGKTVYLRLLAMILGVHNVKITDPDSVVSSTYNPWAEGSLVCGIEEIRIAGQNRFAAINRLKSAITNNTIEVREKYEKNRNIRNVSNYFLCTNHKDAVPMEDGDRRYFVIFSKLMQEIKKDDLKEYFDTLYDEAVNVYPEYIAKWLMEEVEYHDEFDADGTAPMTDDKMVAHGITLSPAAEVIGDLVADGDYPGVNAGGIIYKALTDAVKTEGSSTPEGSLRHALLDLGYVKHHSRHRVPGFSHPQTIWVHHSTHCEEWVNSLKSYDELDDDLLDE